MTGIDGYDWSVFGANPVPGDPDVVRQIARQLADLADEVATQSRLLQSVGQESLQVWSGPAADRFRPTVQKLPDELTKLTNSYNDAADTLNGYWPSLRAAQNLAVEALRKANAAQSAIGAAQSQVSSMSGAASGAAQAYNQAANPLGSPLFVSATNPSTAASSTHLDNLYTQYRAAQTQLGNAQSALSAAQGQMTAAIVLRDQAIRDASDAATKVAGGLSSASAAGIQNPHHSWLSSLFGGAISGLDDAWHGVEGGLKFLMPALKVVDEACAIIGPVLAVVAIALAPIPIVGEAAEGLNEAVLLVKTGDDLLELAGGDAAAETELEWDGLGIATMGLGDGLGAAAEDASDAAGDADGAARATDDVVGAGGDGAGGDSDGDGDGAGEPVAGGSAGGDDDGEPEPAGDEEPEPVTGSADGAPADDEPPTAGGAGDEPTAGGAGDEPTAGGAGGEPAAGGDTDSDPGLLASTLGAKQLASLQQVIDNPKMLTDIDWSSYGSDWSAWANQLRTLPYSQVRILVQQADWAETAHDLHDLPTVVGGG